MRKYNRRSDLPEHKLGDWLKKNAGTALSITGGVASMLPIPGAGAIGAAMTGVGGAVQANTDAKANEAATADQAYRANHASQVSAMSNQLVQGADSNIPVFKNGSFLEYNGQSHAGPDGGIEVDAGGNPIVSSKGEAVGLVEDGETVYVTPDGKPYIFSVELGFAPQAKSIVNKYSRRLGKNLEKSHDPIARRGLEQELDKLIAKQEEVRAELPEVKAEQAMQAQQMAPQEQMMNPEMGGEGMPQFRLGGEGEVTPSDSIVYKNPQAQNIGLMMHMRSKNYVDKGMTDMNLQEYINIVGADSPSRGFEIPKHQLDSLYRLEDSEENMINSMKLIEKYIPKKSDDYKKGGYLKKYVTGGYEIPRHIPKAYNELDFIPDPNSAPADIHDYNTYNPKSISPQPVQNTPQPYQFSQTVPSRAKSASAIEPEFTGPSSIEAFPLKYASGNTELAPMNSGLSPKGAEVPRTVKGAVGEVEDTGKLYSGTPSAIPALATIGANLFGMYDSKRRADNRRPIQAATIGAQRMDLSGARQSAGEQARTARSATRRQAARSGMGAAGYSSVGASSEANINRGLNEINANSHIAEQSANMQSRQRADEFNAQSKMTAQQYNEYSKMQDEATRRRYLDNILGTVAGYGRDVISGQQQANVANMSSDYYDLVSDPRKGGKFMDYVLGERKPRKRVSKLHNNMTKKTK